MKKIEIYCWSKKGRIYPLVKTSFFKEVARENNGILCSRAAFGGIVLFDVFRRLDNLKRLVIS